LVFQLSQVSNGRCEESCVALIAGPGVSSFLPVDNFAVEFAGHNLQVIFNLLDGNVQTVLNLCQNLN